MLVEWETRCCLIKWAVSKEEERRSRKKGYLKTAQYSFFADLAWRLAWRSQDYDCVDAASRWRQDKTPGQLLVKIWYLLRKNGNKPVTPWVNVALASVLLEPNVTVMQFLTALDSANLFAQRNTTSSSRLSPATNKKSGWPTYPPSLPRWMLYRHTSSAALALLVREDWMINAPSTGMTCTPWLAHASLIWSAHSDAWRAAASLSSASP